MTLRGALKLLKPYRKRMAVIMALALVISAISAVSPFISRTMLDNGLLAGDIKVVATLVLLLVALQVGSQLIEYLQRVQEVNISNALGKRLKAEAFGHGLRLKPSYFKEEGFYKTISDALYDISNIMNIADSSFLIIFVVICKCVGALVGLVILDWRLSIFVVAILPLRIWFNAVIRRHAEKRGKELMDDSKAYNSWISNILSGITDIKLWGLGKRMATEYAGHVDAINESSKRLSLLRAKNSLFTMAMEFALMNAMYILGAFLINGGQLTFGGLMAFVTFAAYVSSPVNVILELRIILKQIAPSVEGLRRFNELEEESGGQSLPVPESISTIEFRGVSVSFGGEEVVKCLNLTVRRGEKIAIVGDNGSGKTTVVNLLLRLCEPDEGEILFDGVPISEYDIEGYRRMFSVVSQDTHLFQGTIGENIGLGGTAAAAAGTSGGPVFCTDFIEGWEQAYETQVGSEGSKLSGGERQKIALLRALGRKTSILVLDEPTSNYDKESDEEFNRFIQCNSDYDFYFIVTHRKGVLQHMDKVLDMDD